MIAAATAASSTSSSHSTAATDFGNANVADAVFAQLATEAAEQVTARQPIVIEYDFRALNGFANQQKTD